MAEKIAFVLNTIKQFLAATDRIGGGSIRRDKSKIDHFQTARICVGVEIKKQSRNIQEEI